MFDTEYPGKRVVSGARDGIIRYWNIEKIDEIPLVRENKTEKGIRTESCTKCREGSRFKHFESRHKYLSVLKKVLSPIFRFLQNLIKLKNGGNKDFWAKQIELMKHFFSMLHNCACL